MFDNRREPARWSSFVVIIAVVTAALSKAFDIGSPVLPDSNRGPLPRNAPSFRSSEGLRNKDARRGARVSESGEGPCFYREQAGRLRGEAGTGEDGVAGEERARVWWAPFCLFIGSSASGLSLEA